MQWLASVPSLTNLLGIPSPEEVDPELGRGRDGQGDERLFRGPVPGPRPGAGPAGPALPGLGRAPVAGAAGHGGHVFPVGAFVEYESASQGAWIPAKVLAQRPDGNYDLDCKPSVTPSKVREPVHFAAAAATAAAATASPPAARAPGTPGGPPEFELGSLVEYHSDSRKGWIPARVVSYHAPTGTYDLDCKPKVQPAKIRLPPHLERPPVEARQSDRTAGLGLDTIAERADSAESEFVEPDDHGDGNAREMDADYHSTEEPRRGGESGSSPHLAVHFPVRAGTVQEEAAKPPTVTGHSARDERSPRGGGATDRSARAAAGRAAAEELGSPAAALGGGSSASGSSGRSPASPLGRSLGAKTGGNPSTGQPLRLVRVERSGGTSGGVWRFEVCEEAAAVLDGYGRQKVSICTVCGPYRTGKSLLLNLFLGRLQRVPSGTSAGASGTRFGVGSTTQACTEGLWVWGAEQTAPDGTHVLLMDCEGFGSKESDKVRDAKMMALCLLLSSVFLLNTKGVLNEGLFNALSLVCNVAEHIDRDQGNDVTSKPVLLWLLRDFVLELRDAQNHMLSPNEYLEAALAARPLAAGVDGQRSQTARQVREFLAGYFPRRHCATLVQPIIDEDQLRRANEVPYAELRPEFRSSFETLHAQFLNLAHAQPKTVGGVQLGGAGFVALLRRLVVALNENMTLHIGDAWEQVQHTANAGLASDLYEVASEKMRKVREGAPLPLPGASALPTRDELLARALKEQRALLRQEFRARVLGDETMHGDYWKELRAKVGEEEQQLSELNARLAEDQLAGATTDWQAWLAQPEGEASSGDPRSEALGQLLDRGLPARPAARATREALGAARLARLRWDGAAHALRAELRLATAEVASRTEASRSVGRLDDAALAQTREVGRLQGQVDALQGQARDASQRERDLREHTLELQEALRRAQAERAEASGRCGELEATVRRLEGQVGQHQAAERARRETASPQEPRKANAKCTCSVM